MISISENHVNEYAQRLREAGITSGRARATVGQCAPLGTFRIKDGDDVDVMLTCVPEQDLDAEGQRNAWRDTLDTTQYDYPDRAAWVLSVITELTHGTKSLPICDIGCGAGRDLHCLAGAGYTNLHGIDIAPQCIEMLRSPILGYCGPAEDYPWETSQFHVVMAIASLEHIPREQLPSLITRVCDSCLYLLVVWDPFTQSALHNQPNLIKLIGNPDEIYHGIPYPQQYCGALWRTDTR